MLDTTDEGENGTGARIAAAAVANDLATDQSGHGGSSVRRGCRNSWGSRWCRIGITMGIHERIHATQNRARESTMS